MIPYPFRSAKKREIYDRTFPLPPQQLYHDPVSASHHKKKTLTKPNFSNAPGTWEIDLAYGMLGGNENEDNSRDIHLFCINVNTRYLVVYRLPDKSKRSILRAISNLRLRYPVVRLKGDGERGFAKVLDVIDSSPYTYHNKTVDRVIRTIRDAVGYRIITEEQFQQIVFYYNNTYHRAIDCTPQEMMDNPEIEDQYIRWCIEKLNRIREKTYRQGLYSYKEGNILLLHLDAGKTPEKYKKIRSYWNGIGVFRGYASQSAVVVQLLDSVTGKNVSVPVYYTKLLARNLEELSAMDLSQYTLLLRPRTARTSDQTE
jgi:hypothetical protein